MKVLRLPAYFEPEQAASSFLWQNLSESIAKEGIETVVYTPIPTRGVSSEVRKCYKSRRTETKYEGRLVIHRFPLLGEGKNSLLRAFRYFLQCIIQFNKAVFARDARECDVMFIASTPPIQGALAALIKRFRHIPYVYNLQDIFPDSLVGTGLTSEGSLLWKIGRRLEDFTYRNADRIIVISQDFKNNIVSKGVPVEKIDVVYNWVDEKATTPVDDRENELFEEFGIEQGKFRVVYAGNLGNAQNIDLIVDSARQLRENHQIEFIIFGKGGIEEEIRETIMNEHLSNIKLLPLQPYERVAKVYGLGNICVVACKPGLGGAAMPSKTWSIMSSGRAVLASFDKGELKEIVENNNCGVFIEAGNIDGFVAAIKSLSQNPEWCVKMGRNGRQFILDNLTRDVGTRKYIDVIRQVAGQE